MGAEQTWIGHGWSQKSKLRKANLKQLCVDSRQILGTGPDPSPLPSSPSCLLRQMYQKPPYIRYGALNIQWMAFPGLSSRCYLGPGIKKTVYKYLCICAGTTWTSRTPRRASKLLLGVREREVGAYVSVYIFLDYRTTSWTTIYCLLHDHCFVGF